MKKIAGIATTLAIATAFCGFCTGIASSVNAEAETTPTVSTSAVGTAPKVILSPGRSYNSSVTYSIDSAAGDKVTKLTSAQEGEYFVENAWFANYSAGENLPNATTTRTDVQFVGWRYAVDGETKIVKTMPTVTDDLYLYAHWTTGDVGSNPEVPDKPDPDPDPDPDVPGRPSRVAVTVGNCYIVGQLSGESRFTFDTGILLENDDSNKPEGASHQYKITIALKVGETIKFYYKKTASEANDVWAGWLENNNGSFGTKLKNDTDTNIQVLEAGTYTFYVKLYTNDGGGSVWVEQ